MLEMCVIFSLQLNYVYKLQLLGLTLNFGRTCSSIVGKDLICWAGLVGLFDGASSDQLIVMENRVIITLLYKRSRRAIRWGCVN